MTVKQKQLILCFFDCLPVSGVDGIWGPQSKAATVKLQKKLGIDADGDFGQNTEGEALNAMFAEQQLDGIPTVSEKETVTGDSLATGTFWDEIEYFGPIEFACKCGDYHAPYCDGYPHAIQPLLVRIADRARKHFGQPITIISGLRCQQHNKDSKGHENSQHMYGEAADVYVWGVNPDTVLAWFQSQSDVRYAYRIAGSNNIHFDIPKVGR